MSTTMPVRDSRPSREWLSLRHDARDLFDRFLGDIGYPPDQRNPLPSMDLIERDDAIEVTIDVPGFEADQLDVEVHDNTLIVCGNAETKSEKKGDRTHLSERHRENFQRTLQLPCLVSEDHVQADLHRGVLTITMPKSEETPRRKIPVKG